MTFAKRELSTCHAAYFARFAIFMGTVLTFIGGLVRCISSFPGLGEHIDKEIQYWLCLLGQALVGMGNPMAVSVPTKISQHWFKESQRTFATIALAMSLPLGIVLGQGITPLYVKYKADVPTMNWIWFIPAAVTLGIFLLGVRTSKPPTPPSKSSEVDQESIPYLKRLALSNISCAALPNFPCAE